MSCAVRLPRAGCGGGAGGAGRAGRGGGARDARPAAAGARYLRPNARFAPRAARGHAAADGQEARSRQDEHRHAHGGDRAARHQLGHAAEAPLGGRRLGARFPGRLRLRVGGPAYGLRRRGAGGPHDPARPHCRAVRLGVPRRVAMLRVGERIIAARVPRRRGGGGGRGGRGAAAPARAPRRPRAAACARTCRPRRRRRSLPWSMGSMSMMVRPLSSMVSAFRQSAFHLRGRAPVPGRSFETVTVR